jgi:hypothetical protein
MPLTRLEVSSLADLEGKQFGALQGQINDLQHLAMIIRPKDSETLDHLVGVLQLIMQALLELGGRGLVPEFAAFMGLLMDCKKMASQEGCLILAQMLAPQLSRALAGADLGLAFMLAFVL